MDIFWKLYVKNGACICHFRILNCVMMCLMIINCLQFIHAPFWLQFALITQFFNLRNLISFWTQACELIFKLTHTIFMWNIINVTCIPLCHLFSSSYLLQYWSSIKVAHYNQVAKLMKNYETTIHALTSNKMHANC